MLLKSFESRIIGLLSRNSLKDPVFKRGRLGFYDGLNVPAGSPRIWCHAASVGEATGAVPTLKALRRSLPGAVLCLTSGTPQGLEFARSRLSSDVCVFPFPLDFSKCVSRAVDSFCPDLFVDFETEFWPNFFRELNRRNIPALLLNGRVSDSSSRLYSFLSPLFRPVFSQFTFMAMHSREDAERALRIGAPAGKVMTLGSSKYDDLAERASLQKSEFWQELLAVGDKPVVVGGSLRGSECIELMRVYRGLCSSGNSDIIGIFAPRHMKNIPVMVEWLEKEKIEYDLLSRIEGGSCPRTAPVVLVDRMGVLFEIYSVGDLVFCGGTFEPVGGHNILEPAAWSKPVFYGPHLKKVLHEHRILRDFGGSFLVSDPSDLLFQWKKWVGDLAGLRKNGEAAYRALNSLKGVVAEQMELILKSVPGLN